VPCALLWAVMTPARADAARTAALTALTMLCFAANSLLCRAALAKGGVAIDPVSFTTLRILAGALLLWPLARRVDPTPDGERSGGFGSALALHGYAIAFSLAYVSLEAGAGALVLFGVVQTTMILAGLREGERPRPAQWLGLASAVGGLGYLLLPGLSAPSPIGAGLMAAAGVAWGIYSLRGRGAPRPIAVTAGNFLRAAPLALVTSLVALPFGRPHVEPRGALLAVASGAIASGLGYSLWYRALRGHSATTAAVSQLSVPVIAAAGGVLLLGEAPSARLGLASALVLGGVAVATLTTRRRP
jgi:drug/metabolite transporter (DMT)-like permease